MYHYTKISHVCFNTYLLKQYMVYNKPSFILVQKLLWGLREPSFSEYFLLQMSSRMSLISYFNKDNLNLDHEN